MTRYPKGSVPALAALSALVALGACSSAEPDAAEAAVADGRIRLTAEQVERAGLAVNPVEPRPVVLQLDVPATVSSPDTAIAAVGSLVEGRVESVAVLPGDEVERGAPLVFVHSHELTDALRDLASAEARLAYADAAVGRSSLLLEAGAVSREEVERREADRRAIAAEVARATEWIAHLSPDEDGHVVLRAPRPGVVFEVTTFPGAGVNPGDPLVSLGRTDVLWVTGWIPERESLLLGPGDEVGVRFTSLPDEQVPAHVVRMGGAVDPVRRAVEVRAELTRVPSGVRPGAFATLLLPTSDAELRTVLPTDAVQRTGDGEVVFVEEARGVYRPVWVTSHTLPDGSTAVDGLSAGQRVVTRGAYAVRSAMESGAGEGGS